MLVVHGRRCTDTRSRSVLYEGKGKGGGGDGSANATARSDGGYRIRQCAAP